jgi:hypothetical protein
MRAKFRPQILKGKYHSKHLGVYDDNIRKDVKGTAWKGAGWIYEAKNRDRRRALVSKVMTLRVDRLLLKDLLHGISYIKLPPSKNQKK